MVASTQFAGGGGLRPLFPGPPQGVELVGVRVVVPRSIVTEVSRILARGPGLSVLETEKGSIVGTVATAVQDPRAVHLPIDRRNDM